MTEPATSSSTARGGWASPAGFIIAAVGSAVGLGNLWRFSYTASTGGGAAFVLLYLLLVLIIGLPVLTAELSIGRGTGLSPIRALEKVGGRGWRIVGAMFVLLGFLIFSYYSVIMGWTARMVWDSARGAIPADTGTYFNAISTGKYAVLWHAAGMMLTIWIVLGGVRRGIERAATILMPILLALLVSLAAWAATLTGGSEGYSFYLQPDFSALLDVNLIASAAAQAFFSLSLGMGAMITYASYIRRKTLNLPKQAGIIALSDTTVAFLGGLVVFPIIFHFGLQDSMSSSAIGALFIALPKAFQSIAVGGTLVGTVFFVALYIAALTSAISLLEVVVAGIIDAWGWSREQAALVAGGSILLVGIPSALSLNWMGFIDKFLGEAMLAVGGLLIAILTGWVWSAGADEELSRGFPHPGMRKAWLWLLRIFIPPVLAIVAYTTFKQVVPLARALFGG
jgi:NSS family neurotransmitter:Na+ symporter